jgi:D-glycero-D-manno-heptose 1,7-bisphosphate phosphatase
LSQAVRPRTVILDRDGTIVLDRGYMSDPAQLQFLTNAAAGLALMHRSGHPLVVITNQSGIGRGLFTPAQLTAVSARFTAMVEDAGARLAGVYFCPHRPDEGCACRKPNTQLALEAAAALGFDPARAVVIGDKGSDIELGRRLGATTMLVSADAAPARDGTSAPDYRVRDLLEAAQIILAIDPPSASATRTKGA